MKLQTISDNIRNTIVGKERLLSVFKEKSHNSAEPMMAYYEALATMLEINIDELKRILKDLESA